MQRMRILVLGGDGMLGHCLLRSWSDRHDVRVTLRRDLRAYEQFGLFDERNSYGGVEAVDARRIVEVLADFRPEAVVNAVGIVKQRATARESIPSLEINALFPHRLAVWSADVGARLVHMSTDCVFSGRKGRYRESDIPDPEDLYGRSKLLGEVTEPNSITLRTSIIGLELSRKKSLVEWFLAQEGSVRGFRRAIYSGFTTSEMARILETILLGHPGLTGMWHVASAPISKFDLLTMFADALGRDVRIDPDDTFGCDRSLDGSAFARETGYDAPAWPRMLQELAAEANLRGAKR